MRLLTWCPKLIVAQVRIKCYLKACGVIRILIIALIPPLSPMEDSESGEDSNNDQDFITPRPEGQINHAPTPDSKQQMSELSEFHNLYWVT